MSVQQSFLVCDNSSTANFKAWAQPISTFFTTAGWSASSDTGQVNWSTVTVPGTGAYVYEVWQPNDGLTNFYLKVEYGNLSGSANCPNVRLTIGTTTNGAGTITGSATSALTTAAVTFTAPSAVTTYECDFSGAAGRIGVMLWRNGANNCQQFFGVERSVDSGGSYTSGTNAHVTLAVGGWANGASGIQFVQQSFVFGGPGFAPLSGQATSRNGGFGGLIARAGSLCQNASAAFNGTIPFDTIAPNVGYFDYNLTMCGIAQQADITEGVTFTVTLYGSTRTYMPGKTGAFAYATPGYTNVSTASAFCMRYD